MMFPRRIPAIAVVALVSLVLSCLAPAMASGTAQETLLNASYDPTREFYQAYNALFGGYWKKKSGQVVVVNQSHAGSGAQARAVIEGLDADVVTLGASADIDAIAQRAGLLSPQWQKRLPYDSSPYTSTVVLLVRKGNPKKIHDWNDIVAPGVSIITPNPKTSAGARWNFLAAYAYALHRNHNDDAKAREFIVRLYRNVPVLDAGARGATTTFVERGMGDVLVTWENEAYYVLHSPQGHAYQLIVPSVSILAQPPVAWLDANTNKHGTTALAKEYLSYLYSAPAQRLACAFGYRPVNTSVLKACGTHFQRTDLVKITAFGGWKAVQSRYFSEGGVFDQIYQEK